MTTFTDEQCIAQYLKLASYVSGEEKKLEEALAKHKAGMEGLKAELQKRLIERKANNSATDAGTAYLSDHLNVKVTDRDALLDWCKEHWDNGGGALIVIKPPVDAVRDYQAMHEGKNPPGTETSTHTRCNIRSK
jgi:hypothetical protein